MIGSDLPLFTAIVFNRADIAGELKCFTSVERPCDSVLQGVPNVMLLLFKARCRRVD